MSEALYQPLPQSEVHITDYLAIVMRRRKVFLVAFLTVFSGVVLFTFTVKPTFEAVTILHVQSPKSGKGDLMSEFGGSTQNPTDTEIELIKSRSVSEQVFSRLQQIDPKGARGGG